MRGNGTSTSWDVETIKAPINAALAGSFDKKSVDLMPVYDFDYIILDCGQLVWMTIGLMPIYQN